jgi:hypothetical protein
VCRNAFITTLLSGVQGSPIASVNRILPSKSLSDAHTEVAFVATHVSSALFEQADIRIPVAMVIAGRISS